MTSLDHRLAAIGPTPGGNYLASCACGWSTDLGTWSECSVELNRHLDGDGA